MSAVDDKVAAWANAERNADATVLARLLHPDFAGVGPFGFVLTREQWVQRFAGGLRYTAFNFSLDGPVRRIGDCALVIGTQTQAGAYQGRPIDGSFRVTLVLAGPQWHLSGVHVSLRHPLGPA